MTKTLQQDPVFHYLRLANLLILLFWAVYFINGFLPTHNSIEIVKDFDEFNIAGPGGSSNTSYKKMMMTKRNFTVYTMENEFFTKDTLELKVSPIFGSVKEYRKLSPGTSQEWIRNKLSRYTNALLLTLSIGLTLLTIGLVLVRMKPTLFKTLCLLNAIGAILFFLSVVS